jgi:hypothetical protein
MSNANRPAFPLATEELSDRHQNGIDIEHGLTKREYFAGMALQGLLSNPERVGSIKEATKAAIWFADALIAELEKDND